ncbi:hypothetical protein K402DRAFT_454972 [Aulographum hederae CBS 113979]|uniref:Uncharacterized protein n=1 Tax=Aulographum hederae CBS 113979 TaxID=1176131 RepID=A0A6G1GXH9_9PEZI|nr:hypothetical protein K402DRAFT_454972 [Aulographum hederae CBS 113979]
MTPSHAILLFWGACLFSSLVFSDVVPSTVVQGVDGDPTFFQLNKLRADLLVEAFPTLNFDPPLPTVSFGSAYSSGEVAFSSASSSLEAEYNSTIASIKSVYVAAKQSSHGIYTATNGTLYAGNGTGNSTANDETYIEAISDAFDTFMEVLSLERRKLWALEPPSCFQDWIVTTPHCGVTLVVIGDATVPLTTLATSTISITVKKIPYVATLSGGHEVSTYELSTPYIASNLTAMGPITLETMGTIMTYPTTYLAIAAEANAKAHFRNSTPIDETDDAYYFDPVNNLAMAYTDLDAASAFLMFDSKSLSDWSHTTISPPAYIKDFYMQRADLSTFFKQNGFDIESCTLWICPALGGGGMPPLEPQAVYHRSVQYITEADEEATPAVASVDVPETSTVSPSTANPAITTPKPGQSISPEPQATSSNPAAATQQSEFPSDSESVDDSSEDADDVSDGRNDDPQTAQDGSGSGDAQETQPSGSQIPDSGGSRDDGEQEPQSQQTPSPTNANANSNTNQMTDIGGALWSLLDMPNSNPPPTDSRTPRPEEDDDANGAITTPSPTRPPYPEMPVVFTIDGQTFTLDAEPIRLADGETSLVYHLKVDGKTLTLSADGGGAGAGRSTPITLNGQTINIALLDDSGGGEDGLPLLVIGTKTYTPTTTGSGTAVGWWWYDAASSGSVSATTTKTTAIVTGGGDGGAGGNNTSTRDEIGGFVATGVGYTSPATFTGDAGILVPWRGFLGAVVVLGWVGRERMSDLG